MDATLQPRSPLETRIRSLVRIICRAMPDQDPPLGDAFPDSGPACVECGHGHSGVKEWGKVHCATYSRAAFGDVITCLCRNEVHATVLIRDFYDRPWDGTVE